MKILWNLLCQYNNIYKRKKITNGRQRKPVTTVATMLPSTIAIVWNYKKEKKKRQSASPNFHCRWTVGYVESTVRKHCNGIAAFYIVNRYY